MISEAKFKEATNGSEQGMAFQADVDKADASMVKEPPLEQRSLTHRRVLVVSLGARRHQRAKNYAYDLNLSL